MPLRCAASNASAIRMATRAACSDRKSTRLNSSHLGISYAVFGMKKKTAQLDDTPAARRKRSERGHAHKPVTVVQGCAKKKFRWRRPRHTLKGRYFFFNDTATTESYTLSLHDALPIWHWGSVIAAQGFAKWATSTARPLKLSGVRSEEHTSELQSLRHLVCRLLLD